MRAEFARHEIKATLEYVFDNGVENVAARQLDKVFTDRRRCMLGSTAITTEHSRASKMH